MLERPHTAFGDRDFSTWRALVIDPSAATRRSVGQALDEAGVPVTATARYERGEGLCSTAPDVFRVVILALTRTAGTPGFETARRLSRMPADRRPILIGMVDTQEDLDPDLCGMLGMHEVLLKPVHKWLLIRIVQDAVSPRP